MFLNENVLFFPSFLKNWNNKKVTRLIFHTKTFFINKIMEYYCRFPG